MTKRAVAAFGKWRRRGDGAVTAIGAGRKTAEGKTQKTYRCEISFDNFPALDIFRGQAGQAIIMSNGQRRPLPSPVPAAAAAGNPNSCQNQATILSFAFPSPLLAGPDRHCSPCLRVWVCPPCRPAPLSLFIIATAMHDHLRIGGTEDRQLRASRSDPIHDTDHYRTRYLQFLPPGTILAVYGHPAAMEADISAALSELITSYHELNGNVVQELDGEPSPLEFMRYVAANTPFVVRGAAAAWHATSSWSASFLREALVNHTVNVAVTPKGFVFFQDSLVFFFGLPHTQFSRQSWLGLFLPNSYG